MILSSSWSIVSNFNIGDIPLSQTDLPGIVDVESKRCFDIVGLSTKNTRQAVISFDHCLTVSRRSTAAVDIDELCCSTLASVCKWSHISLTLSHASTDLLGGFPLFSMYFVPARPTPVTPNICQYENRVIWTKRIGFWQTYHQHNAIRQQSLKRNTHCRTPSPHVIWQT